MGRRSPGCRGGGAGTDGYFPAPGVAAQMKEKVRGGQANFREAARNLGEHGDDCGNRRFGDSPLVFSLAALHDPADCVRRQVKEGKPQNEY